MSRTKSHMDLLDFQSDSSNTDDRGLKGPKWDKGPQSDWLLENQYLEWKSHLLKKALEERKKKKSYHPSLSYQIVWVGGPDTVFSQTPSKVPS